MNKEEEIKNPEIDKDTESHGDSNKIDIQSDEENLSENDNQDYLKDKTEVIEAEEKLTEEILQNEIEKLRDEKLRLLAEMDNLRKRSDRDRADSVRYGSINLARDILSPDDNLSRALEAITDEQINSDIIKNLIEGLKMVQREFSTILQRYGVKKIDALNSKFDHNYHQAMVEIENNDVEPGTVIQEMQSGYIMHDRLLRPSMVGVSKKSSNKNKDTKKT